MIHQKLEQTQLRMRAFPHRKPTSEPKIVGDAAAVLVPLCVKDGDVCLLYTKRSAGLRKHGREVI